MHSPGKELDLVRPRSFRKFLFEHVPRAEEFRRQHEGFVDLLRSERVEVVLITELLKHPTLLSAIEKHPNLVFTRDTVTVNPAGYILMRMMYPVRRREPTIVEAALLQLGLQHLMKTKSPGTMEGGDLIFLDEETLLVGVGNRTSWKGFQQLNRTATRSGLKRLIAVQLPPTVIHLDGTMMVCGPGLGIVHAKSLGSPALMYEEGKFRERIRLTEFLRKRGLNLIEITDKERRKRATNVIGLRPGRVAGYAGNARVKARVEREGLDFLEIEGSELLRGAGGPRCMTAPLLRD
jgi:arginine deiminase